MSPVCDANRREAPAYRDSSAAPLCATRVRAQGGVWSPCRASGLLCRYRGSETRLIASESVLGGRITPYGTLPAPKRRDKRGGAAPHLSVQQGSGLRRLRFPRFILVTMPVHRYTPGRA